ncbi:MAG: hypothetical protein PVH61_21720 [Candidatus Aminicenantes bacterium]|jgi:hypothetical protein
MRRQIKIVLILFCIIYWTFGHDCLQGKPLEEKANNLKYRFEYTFFGETTGVFLLFFRYRVFFYVNASVLLEAKKIDQNTFQFNYIDIDKTGYIIRTWGFTGKTLITGAADYDLEKAQQILDKGFSMFKEKAPDFARVNKRQKVFPFKILSRGKNVMTFKREINGIHRDVSLDMQLKSVKYERKYDFYFKIYPMMLEMVKIYNHSIFPGNIKNISQLEPGMKWQSPALDFSDNMNGVGSYSAYLVDKYVTFRQRSPFKLSYRVVSREPGKLTIHGEAAPVVKIWDGYKVLQVNRTIEIRLPDGAALEDSFYVGIGKKEGKGGFAKCSLTLIQ